MKTLFDKTEIDHLKFKNRLFRSATWDGLAAEDGTLTEEIYSIYEELAKGGGGTIITGLTDISEYDQALLGNMRLYSDLHIESYRKLTELCHHYDCNIIPQINLNYYVSSASNGAFYRKDIDNLTEKDITHIIELFCGAAERALKAGFDGIQIHAAFNWLLNRSFNPAFNHRTDEYGGNMKKRCRLVVEVLKAIRHSFPDIFIAAKVGFYSDFADIQAIEQYVSVCKELADNGISAIEISCNNHLVGQTDAEKEAEFLPLAKVISENVKVPLILVGRNRHLENMEDILKNTPISYFSMCRSLIREPDLPNRWESGDIKPAKCISCDSCFQMYAKRCVFNR